MSDSGTLGFVDYAKVREACEGLSDAQVREVERLRSQAMAYVWGFQDGSLGSGDSGEAWNFSTAYALHAAQYEREARCYRRAIPDSFKRFRQGLAIED